MAVMDASVSLFVRSANRIDLRAWQLGRIESMGKRRHVLNGGLVGSFIFGLLMTNSKRS